MSWYALNVFVHIAGVLVIVGAVAVELLAGATLIRARSRAQVEVLRIYPHAAKWSKIGAALLILGTGVYLTVTHIQAGRTYTWIIVSIVLFLGIAGHGGMIDEKAITTLRAALAERPRPGGEVGPEVRGLGTTMLLSAVYGLTLTAGITLLMVARPGAVASVVIGVATVALGYVLYLPLARAAARPLRAPAPQPG